MAQTYRLAKIEKFYEDVEFSYNHYKEILESDRIVSENVRNWMEGQMEAHERIMKKFQREFDLATKSE